MPNTTLPLHDAYSPTSNSTPAYSFGLQLIISSSSFSHVEANLLQDGSRWAVSPIFREVVTAADLEKELESVDVDGGTGSSAEIVAETNEFSWDRVLDDVEDEGDDEIESFE